MRLIAAITLTSCLYLVAATAGAERRVALVIGNDNYTYLPKLNNAGKDARDMASKLKGLGFDVIASFNASQRNMGRAIAKFSARLSAGGTGLVFYAGHGVQANGRNYLIPVNSELVDETDLKYGAIDTLDILAAMRDAGNPLNILIMDACRDNPLPKRSRSSSRGLAITSVPQGAKGTAIIYAAGPGQTAADGTDGGNSVFTGALLKHIGKPGWTLQKVLQATSREVLDRTNNKQRPWQLVSMQGEFRFRSAGKTAVVRPRQTVGSGDQAEVVFWQSIKDSDDLSVYQAYFDQYPSGIFSALARIKIAKLEKMNLAVAAPREAANKQAKAQEKEQWQTALAANDADMIRAFLNQHPNSVYAGLAKTRIESLRQNAKKIPRVQPKNDATNIKGPKTTSAAIITPKKQPRSKAENEDSNLSITVRGVSKFVDGKIFRVGGKVENSILKQALKEYYETKSQWAGRYTLVRSSNVEVLSIENSVVRLQAETQFSGDSDGFQDVIFYLSIKNRRLRVTGLQGN